MAAIASSSASASTPSAHALPAPRAPAVLRRMLSLHDFEEAARRRLPRPIFGYIAGAAEDNASLRDNREVFGEWGLTTRVLADVSQRSQAVELFGERYASPFGIAPMGINALSTYRGDLVLARAAQRAGIVSVMSGTSLIPMEEVARESPATWFQAYIPGDQARIDALIDRVERAGFRTLVVTVDIPISANRENNIRTGFSTPLKPSLRLAWDGMVRPGWVAGTFLRTLLRHGMPHFENSFATRGAPIMSSSVMRDFSARDHLSWHHIEAIRRRWKGPLVIKGVLSVEDALQARRVGADGIVLSNHGGRQLDSVASTISQLPAVAGALDGRLPILLDGGVRSGVDLLKALALGAQGVLIGRPWAWALAGAGQAGVQNLLEALRNELAVAMALCGVSRIEQINAELLEPCQAG